jgi:periplasmic protein TonB
MEANKILKSTYLDILFEGRNKEYGAYDLRKTYNKRIKVALASTVVILVLIFVVSVIADKLSSSNNVKEIQTKDLVMEAAPKEEGMS